MKGEKATPVVFWKILERSVEDPDTSEIGREGIPLLRYYSVFNVEQTGGLEARLPAIRKAFDPIEAAEETLRNMPKPPTIQYGEAQAYYRVSTDTVNMPHRELFQSGESFYATLFHEISHSTGHSSRLNRFLKETALPPLGSADYSQEELVAELGAAFLCGHCGIATRTLDNSAAYIAGWLKRLQDDRKLIVVAAAQAQKAADYVRNVQPQA